MSIEKQAINTLRNLALDQINAAQSGHPGLPLGAAPMAYAVFSSMKHSGKNPSFFNRDRFVLSAGHGSSLLYALLHAFEYGLTKEDLERFRQLNSFTPGHPEYGHTKGVETTTGPLGQGAANAVGMALAEKILAARFNRDGQNVIDHHTYAILGDGCMQEGIEYEAASFAGTQKLNKLIFLYDKNNITIEGGTDLAFREDVGRRHEAMGWNVITVDDGEDVECIKSAIAVAKKSKEKPTLIIVNTVIGHGSPLAGKSESHGAPLKAADLAATKKYFGNAKVQPFEVLPEVKEHFQALIAECAKGEDEWKKAMRDYRKKHPEAAEELDAFIKNKMPDPSALEDLYDFSKADATRNTSGIVLNKLAQILPNLIGGSADLAPSTKAWIKDAPAVSPEDANGRNIHFGIREHAMSAISNGIYLHGGFNVFCSTFFSFSDYMKNAVRLSALMNLPIIYVFTHDSIGVGEDGPTHQPVEHLASLRTIPNLKTFRPCDGKETAAAYVSALTGDAPTAIVCSRQTLPLQAESGAEALKGAYTLVEAQKEVPDMLLFASGSEVDLIVQAAKILSEKHSIDARVISVPCMEVFEKQTQKYKDALMPKEVRARLAVEAASSICWHKYVGLDGDIIGIDTFGMSGPADKIFEIYGFTVDNVVDKAVKTFKRAKKSSIQVG